MIVKVNTNKEIGNYMYMLKINPYFTKYLMMVDFFVLYRKLQTFCSFTAAPPFQNKRWERTGSRWSACVRLRPFDECMIIIWRLQKRLRTRSFFFDQTSFSVEKNRMEHHLRVR